MARKPPKSPEPSVVPHPRYGTQSVASGFEVSEEAIRGSFWGYHHAKMFPASAIPADTRRQNFTVIARGYYVDLLQECRRCHQPFIFFAREQQYWYETLGFYIDAACVHCVECRRSDQEMRRRFKRYAANAAATGLDDKQLATLILDAVYLWRAGLIRDEQKLRRLRNLAHRRLPGSKAARRIDEAIALGPDGSSSQL